MAANDRESRINRLARYRWKPGQSGNAAGRPKKHHELRWYVEGAMLNVRIAPEFYRNAMVICGMQKEVERLDALLLSGAKLQDVDVQNASGEFKQLAREVGQRTARKGPALFMPLRAALTGATHGPELAPLFALMTAAQIRERFEQARSVAG